MTLDIVPPRAWNMHHGKPEGPVTITVNGITRARLVYVGRSRKWGGPGPLAGGGTVRRQAFEEVRARQNETP